MQERISRQRILSRVKTSKHCEPSIVTKPNSQNIQDRVNVWLKVPQVLIFCSYNKPANNFCLQAGHLSVQRPVLTGQEASLYILSLTLMFPDRIFHINVRLTMSKYCYSNLSAIQKWVYVQCKNQLLQIKTPRELVITVVEPMFSKQDDKAF